MGNRPQKHHNPAPCDTRAEPRTHRARRTETWARLYVPLGWHRACARPHALWVPQGNSLPNLIDDFLLLLDFIPEPGQLLLMSFPVTLHLLLQCLLQPRPRGMCQPLLALGPHCAKTGALAPIPPPSAVRSPYQGPGPTLIYRDNHIQGSLRKLSSSHGQMTTFHKERVCLWLSTAHLSHIASLARSPWGHWALTTWLTSGHGTSLSCTSPPVKCQ